MRLRSIELGGYKSFGNRTLLRFDAGLTAVVGPNGSGKSNIMDALRWVIGEGANRSLRVRRLDDVIFTGSAERAPAGLAEVRLKLDNEDGWLGLEAAEVEVQRRVHRDGESEFRLNGRSVRLREIQELFHNSGLGAGGYALMGQGLVDEVLRLRPQERRRLIEEVADLRRHRRKMLESRRQRERAEQHLERARLLRDEIAPRLRALERQARRARRREELEAELNAALRAWYAAAAAQLTDEERRRRDAAQAALEAQQQAEEERTAAAAAASSSERAVDAARAAAEAAAAERRAAQARLSELRHALELDQRRRDWLTGEAGNLGAELGSAAPDGGPPPDVESAASALAAAEAALREARERRDRAQRERDEHAHRRAVAEALQQRLEAERAELEGESGALDTALAAQQETVEALAAACAEAATADSDAAQALATARADEAEAAEALERIDVAQSELRDARAAIEREIDDLTARITALDDFGAPAANNAAPRLLSRLRIQPGYEMAIEAALGAAAEAEVQPTTAAALARARAALRRDEPSWIGVAADIAADIAAGGGQRRPTAAAHPNGAGSGQAVVAVGLTALDVIDAPPDLRPIVDALLGGVRIVDDAEQARTLLAEAEQAIVTRDGILLRADGVVATRSGQGAARARQQQRLAEWREQRSAKRRELERQPSPNDARRAQAAQERDAAAALVRERVESHTAAGAGLADADRALQAAQAEREHLDGGARGVRSRLERVRADLEAASEPVAPPAAEPVPPEQGELAALEQERDAAMALHADARARAEQIAHHSQAAARLAAAREELDSLRLTLAEREQAVADAETAAADDAAPAAARSALETAEQERAACRRRLETAQSERLAAERAAVEAQAALRETRAAAQRLMESAEEDQIDLAQLPPPAVDAPVDADRLRSDANALRERLGRLGAAPPDAAEQHEAELQRFTALDEQIDDLEATEARLREAERELETLIGSGFRGAFEKVDAAFQRYFRLMFRGGRAQLRLTQEPPPVDADGPSADAQLELEGVRAEPELPPAGVEIVAQPPGKRVGSLDQLSGGERALTAIALLFALLEVRPVPFCVLDEVDAALDEANVERFVQALKERAADIQFVVITHNRRTIEQADAIYGVTMASDGLSKVLSVRLDNLPATQA